MQDTLTGTWLVVAGAVVALLAHFNIVIPQTAIESIISGGLVVYGAIHQLIVSRTATGSLR